MEPVAGGLEKQADAATGTSSNSLPLPLRVTTSAYASKTSNDFKSPHSRSHPFGPLRQWWASDKRITRRVCENAPTTRERFIARVA
jgi:hypothetical protein